MATEIETKVIDYDKRKARDALRKIGARFAGKSLQRRWVFDFPGKAGKDKFVRIRTDGKRAALAYKSRRGSAFDNTEEIEVEISDFNTAAKIFFKFLKNGYYQENRLELYRYKGAAIEFKKWAGIPEVLEIEGRSVAQVDEIVKMLGIEGRVMGNISWARIYAHYGVKVKREPAPTVGV